MTKFITEDELESGLPFVKEGTIAQILALIYQHDARLNFGIMLALTQELLKDSGISIDRWTEALRDHLQEREDEQRDDDDATPC